jgi:hypothetical protein
MTMKTPENEADVASHEFSDVFEIDAELRSMKHAVTIANRLKDRGRWDDINEMELAELRRRYTDTLIRRSSLQSNAKAEPLRTKDYE